MRVARARPRTRTHSFIKSFLKFRTLWLWQASACARWCPCTCIAGRPVRPAWCRLRFCHPIIKHTPGAHWSRSGRWRWFSDEAHRITGGHACIHSCMVRCASSADSHYHRLSYSVIIVMQPGVTHARKRDCDCHLYCSIQPEDIAFGLASSSAHNKHVLNTRVGNHKLAGRSCGGFRGAAAAAVVRRLFRSLFVAIFIPNCWACKTRTALIEHPATRPACPPIENTVAECWCVCVRKYAMNRRRVARAVRTCARYT